MNFFKDHLESYGRALRQMDSSVTGTPSFASTSGNATSAFHVTTTTVSPWIIDSGASDHMTNLSTLFVSYDLLPGRDKITLADGSLASISGKGTVKAIDSLLLSSTLHVPKLNTNLLSVSSLTKSCQLSKHCRNNYPLSNKRSYFPFNIVHFDMWGPYHLSSMGGYRYFILFIDDF